MQRSSDQILTEWLVLSAQGGNAQALDQLLRIWYPKLLRYATHQVRNAEAAKDVVQEALMAVAKRITRLDDPAAFPKWTYQILQRRGVDYLRKEIRNRRNSSVGESFKGAFGWAVKVVFFFVFVFIGLTVYCAINFFHADDIGTKLNWLAMSLAAFIVVAILRLWYFMELNRLSIKREVKRLELQVALLANKIQSLGQTAG